MKNLDSNLLSSLVKLGLTFDEARCYLHLENEGSLSASTLAKLLGIFPNAVYRLTYNLIAKGFIVKLDAHPTKFQAISPSIAIDAYSKGKIKDLEKINALVINGLSKNQTSSNQTKIDILTGKNSMFAKSAKLIKMAKKEVLIISIGESVPEEIILANRDAIEKGVQIKFIAHKFDKNNESLLKNWVKMGLEVRHYPDWGYHLQIIDGKISLLATNNPLITKERTAMLIYNEALSKSFRNYFLSLWEKSKTI